MASITPRQSVARATGDHKVTFSVTIAKAMPVAGNIHSNLLITVKKNKVLPNWNLGYPVQGCGKPTLN